MYIYPEIPQEILETIRSCTTAVVIGHVGPDGDCVHSQIATQKLLQKMGVEAHLVNTGPFQRKEIREYEPLFAPHIGPQLKAKKPLVVMPMQTTKRAVNWNLMYCWSNAQTCLVQ